MSNMVFGILGPRTAYQHAEAGRVVEQHVEHLGTYENNTGIEPGSRGHHEQVDCERV